MAKNNYFWLAILGLWAISLILTIWFINNRTEDFLLEVIVEPPIIIDHPKKGKIYFRSPTQDVSSFELKAYLSKPIVQSSKIGALLNEIFKTNTGVFCIIPKNSDDLQKFLHLKNEYQDEQIFIYKYLATIGYSDKTKIRNYWGIGWTDLNQVRVSFFHLPQISQDPLYSYLYFPCAPNNQALITKDGWIKRYY
jgi:hypothetical protein